MRYYLPANKTLMVRGPASIRLLTGELNVLGAPIMKGRNVAIHSEKRLPIHGISESEIELTLSESNQVKEVEGNIIPDSWQKAIEILLDMSEGLVIIIGPTDVGKSTFCTYALNKFLTRKINARIIDADIGQADIGPPTTISSAIPTSPIFSLTQLDPERIVFVGHTTPSMVETKVICGIRRLLHTESQGLTIVNTDGWLLDSSAINYKSRMISAINPNIVIGIGSTSALNVVRNGSRANWVSVETPKLVLARSRNARKENRESAYRRFLHGGTIKKIRLDTMRIRFTAATQQAFSRRSSKLNNLLVGLLDDEEFMHELGVFIGIDKTSIHVYTRSLEDVRILEFGCVKISTDGSEIGYIN